MTGRAAALSPERCVVQRRVHDCGVLHRCTARWRVHVLTPVLRVVQEPRREPVCPACGRAQRRGWARELAAHSPAPGRLGAARSATVRSAPARCLRWTHGAALDRICRIVH